MPPRENNKTFLDKFLGIFGIKRPRKNKAKVSKRRTDIKRPQYEINNGFEIPIDDDFLIVPNEKRAKQESGRTAYSNGIKSGNFDNNDSMNKNTSKRTTNPKNKTKQKKKHPVLSAMLSVFLVIVITGCIVVGAALIYVFGFIDDTVDADLYNLKLEYTSILYAKDSKGKDVELTRLHGDENRLWVDYDDIPEEVKYAFISCEDKRFDKHKGVDWKRTFFAFANEVFSIRENRQGGSTITQQLVKNITKDDEIDASRKIREIMRARYLEQHYDKDTILECYLNTIHLGNGTDGVEVAASYYFDKHASEINLVQAACLAAITNNPSENEPYNNPENNKNRRNWVLDEMYNNGYISKEECEKAKEADLELRKNPSTILSSAETVEEKEEFRSYFVDAVIEEVIEDLVEEKGYSSNEVAREELLKGGYKIYTTVDLEMQEKLEAVYLNEDNFMNVYTVSGKKPQSAMTIMDYDGNVKALVGGRGEKTGNSVLNRAVQSPRPTGSSIKPISIYAPAFEYNIINWGTSIEDKPITKLENGVTLDQPWPKNANGSYSYSKTSMLYAIQQSLNTVPVRILQDMTIDTAYKFVTEKMGLSHFVEMNEDGKSDKTESSLALGGSVHGATTLEMAAAFSTFGNGGIYYEPRTYSKILDQNNDVVIDNTKNQHRAISEGTAGIMNKMLQTVATSGTGTSAQFGNWQIMCKTGTTSDNKDRWFVGGTPYYMAACWFGMDTPEEMSNMWTNPAIILWKAAMSEIHKDLDYKEFETTDKIEFRRYCTSSGCVARTGCPSTAYGYYKTSYTPYCNYHSGAETGVQEYQGYYGNNYNSGDDDDEENTTKKKDGEGEEGQTSTTKKGDDKTKAQDKSEQSTGNDEPGEKTTVQNDEPSSTEAPTATSNASPSSTNKAN